MDISWCKDAAVHDRLRPYRATLWRRRHLIGRSLPGIDQEDERTKGKGGGRQRLKHVDGDVPLCMQNNDEERESELKKIEKVKGKGGGRQGFRYFNGDVPLCMRSKEDERESKSKVKEKGTSSKAKVEGSSKKVGKRRSRQLKQGFKQQQHWEEKDSV